MRGAYASERLPAPAVLDEQLGFDVADVAWIPVNGDGSREAALVAARRALLRTLPRHAAS